ncbi:ribbon-helix-helix protein, CopG family [Candidatus Bathyarchaeota archaeon]|nr:ribbon-helix-helix protein, CopG family [Candidatus Bathyarchaeota archaeon]
MSNTSRYVTVSIPKAIARKIDYLIEVLGYWPSRSAFVREACLEKITGEERRLRELRSSGGDGPIRTGGGAPSGD